MTDHPEPSICHYCRREFKEGEGRYRLLQQKNEVECCPACFDATHMSPRRPCTGPAFERTLPDAEEGL